MSKRLVVVIVALVVAAIGYLGGRYHIIGQLRQGLFGSNDAGVAANARRDEAYAAIERLIDGRIERHHQDARIWRELLDTDDPQRRAELAWNLRSELTGLLRPWPGPVLDDPPAIEPWLEDADVEVSLVELPTFPGVTLPCALLVPRDADGPRPAILALHGFDGTLESVVEDVDYHHGFGMELARRGFVVLAPLMASSTVDNQSRLQMKAVAAGWSMAAIDLWQLRRALDYVFTLDVVDPAHVGLYGISWGGQHALRLGALDERPSLVLCSGYFADRFSWLFDNPDWPEGDGRVHIHFLDDMALLLDDLNLVALIQPRFLGIECGRRDPRHPTAVAEFDNVARLYERAGHADRAELIEFDGGHEISIESVMPFLERWAAADLAER